MVLRVERKIPQHGCLYKYVCIHALRVQTRVYSSTPTASVLGVMQMLRFCIHRILFTKSQIHLPSLFVCLFLVYPRALQSCQNLPLHLSPPCLLVSCYQRYADQFNVDLGFSFALLSSRRQRPIHLLLVYLGLSLPCH